MFSVAVVALVGCGGENCSLPRKGDEQSCDAYDGGQWSFVAGEPLPDFSAYCASPCVDVHAPIAIAGYDDLRKVPLLPKMRLIQRLRVNLDGLKDLRGLENADVVRDLTFFGQNGDSSPKTLEGLSDREVEVFAIEQVTGLASLESASVEQVVSFAVDRSSLHRLDLSGLQASYVNVTANEDLRSLAFGAGEVKQVTLQANPQLTELSWGPEFRVREQLFFESNTALSSCLIQQFAAQTDAGVRRMEFFRNNGPCP